MIIEDMKKIRELKTGDKVWYAELRVRKLHKLRETEITESRRHKPSYGTVRLNLKVAENPSRLFVDYLWDEEHRNRYGDDDDVLCRDSCIAECAAVISTDKDALKAWLREHLTASLEKLAMDESAAVSELVHIRNTRTEIGRNLKRIEKF